MQEIIKIIEKIKKNKKIKALIFFFYLFLNSSGQASNLRFAVFLIFYFF